MRAEQSSSRSGWALGEQATYCKMANFELQTRVPMMVRAPWLKSTGSTTALAELVDMCAEPSPCSHRSHSDTCRWLSDLWVRRARYPTAVELSGLGLDKSTEALEGNSLLPVLRNPSLHLDTPAGWKQAVFMQYPRCMNSTIALEPPFLAQRDACIGHNANLVTHMVRTLCLATFSYKHAISNLVLSS